MKTTNKTQKQRINKANLLEKKQIKKERKEILPWQN